MKINVILNFSKTKPYICKNRVISALLAHTIKIYFIHIVIMMCCFFGFSQDIPKKSNPVKQRDTIKLDSVKIKKETLEHIVKYKAKDYTKFNRRTKILELYNEAKVDYGDISIEAGEIIIDSDKNTVRAKGIRDTANAYIQKPVFKQGSNVVEPDSIVFNIKTKKSLIYNSKTEQGQGTVIAEVTKKENDSVYFVKNAKYTTAKNLEDPEYYIKLRKAKIVPGKKIVTGLANLFIYDVPTPIGLPFGFFPQTEKHTSGIIIPSFGEQNDRGYFLQNGGYYFAVSDYLDLVLLGDYYTNGSYGTRIESTYKKRYKFSGNFGFRFENIISSERGFSDFSRSTIYNLRWSHSQDAKASPSSRFSASVNLGSSRFFRTSINQINLASTLNNTLSSSISYSKSFRGEPSVNLNLTATHTQNTNTEVVNLTLPTLQASVSRIYPFSSNTGTRKGIFKNLNLQYNIRGENRIQTTDSLFFKKEMFDDARVGVNHSIPLTTNFKIFKYLSASAGANFSEVWTLNTIDRRFDTATRQVITEDINGFDAFRTYNFSASLGTTVYGTFNFEKEGKNRFIKAIRHVMRPSVGYSINPAFDQYYDTYEVVSADGLTREDVSFTRFEQSIFGAPSRNFSSAMNISLSNNIEAKVRSKDSTSVEPRKVILLNNLNFSTSYNFAGDSLQWNPIRMNGSTQLFKGKMNINFSATLDPYALDNNNNLSLIHI